MTSERPSGAMRGDPRYTWEDTVAAIGKDFSGGKARVAQEVIENTLVVRYCEPWEIGNPIYWYEDVARQAGYRGVAVPWSAIKQTFTSTSFWRPGERTRFPSPDRDGSARSSASQEEGREDLPLPPYSNGVVTDVLIEFFEPVCVGDRLTVKGDKIANVRPRKTRIGFGAFINRENEIYNQQGALVARVNQGVYNYTAG